MNKKESKFQIEFNKYLRSTKLRGYFELKQATGSNAMYYTSIEPHQIDGLLAAQQNGMVYKLSDADMRIKPFDCISTPPLPGYIVILYGAYFYIILIDRFIQYRDLMKRKTLKEEEAKHICATYVRL